MLILFQSKILYMPSIPPFSRFEKITDYAALCRPVVWREKTTMADDGVEVAVAAGSGVDEDRDSRGEERKREGGGCSFSISKGIHPLSSPLDPSQPI